MNIAVNVLVLAKKLFFTWHHTKETEHKNIRLSI